MFVGVLLCVWEYYYVFGSMLMFVGTQKCIDIDEKNQSH